VQSVPRLYSESCRGHKLAARIEALRDIGGDEKGTQCLGVKLGHPVPRGHEYGDLALQVEGVSNLRQLNMVMSPAGLGPEMTALARTSINCQR
jgi:hypothetical protein